MENADDTSGQEVVRQVFAQDQATASESASVMMRQEMWYQWARIARQHGATAIDARNRFGTGSTYDEELDAGLVAVCAAFSIETLIRRLADLVVSATLQQAWQGTSFKARLRETLKLTRFRSEACFAMHAGTAPIPASSGKTIRASAGPRREPATQRRVAPHRRHPDPPRGGPGHNLLPPPPGHGNTKMEALRAMKRRLARVIFNLLRPDTTQQAALPAAA